MPRLPAINPQLSEELRAVAWKSHCPKCHKWLLAGLASLRYFDAAGNQLGFSSVQGTRRDITAQCPKCLATLPVWRHDSASKSDSTWTVQAIVETERFEERIGNDERVIDASNTSATIVRNITFSKEWSRSLTIESEESSSRSMSTGLDLNSISIRSTAEQALRNRYNVSTTERETRTEEMSISVPGGTRQQIILQWKRVWQKGIVQLADKTGRRIDLPFNVAVDVTFDQKVIDGAI
jgi:hypothetical protein